MGVLDRTADRRDGLRTDLYQLTMAAAYFENGLEHRATFELFTRRLEANRGFYVACGLELALDYLEGLRFSGSEIDYLRHLPVFEKVSPRFFERIRELRFSGDVWAMPEGTPFFPDEPILRVSGPALEAQLVETYLLSLVNEQTLIATKAARCCSVAPGKHLSDFGTRRAHGPEAGALVARAAYVAGFRSTSNVEAGHRLGIPVRGTFAHSWVLSFDDEREAFLAYQRVFPGDTAVLLDTYDTLAAARAVASLGVPVASVRLDSGDFAALSRAVRQILDGSETTRKTKIIASGDLNEDKVDALEKAGAPIDVYGIGTELAVSKDMPALGGVYKLVEREGPGGEAIPVAKFSESKATLPGAKQVWRHVDSSGRATHDTLALAREGSPGGKPLLEHVLAAGTRTRPSPTLEALRERTHAALETLPPELRALRGAPGYRVERTPALLALAAEVTARRKS